MDLTGAQLLRLLEQQWERPQPPGGRVLPVSEGFGYTWDASQPAGAAKGKGRRVVPGSMRLHGQAVSLERSYRVTVNSFMADGGDALNIFKQGRNRQEGDTDLAAAKRYLSTRSPMAPPPMGRIQRVN
jgi:5'-nucleotidase